MAKKEFKSESKRLLDLMINSIYTHKEIFLVGLYKNLKIISAHIKLIVCKCNKAKLINSIACI